ncbi:hypothetical protein BKI51_00210 [Alphaproteobacteria bacterium AO1-B]|nr:hypothetical protein BKI51_00210 [Alphaproteobacteria bacterium AO1-B]
MPVSPAVIGKPFFAFIHELSERKGMFIVPYTQTCDHDFLGPIARFSGKKEFAFYADDQIRSSPYVDTGKNTNYEQKIGNKAAFRQV